MPENKAARFTAVAPKRLTEAIASQIEGMILRRELTAGDALPAERLLASQFGVSRNVLREAVGTLVQKGLLEVRPGSGTYVTQPGIDFIGDSLTFLVRFNAKAMLELVEARRSLEVEIVGLAATRAEPRDIVLIKEQLESMDAASTDPAAYVEADVQFHEALAAAAKNQVLRLLLRSTRAALRESIGVLAKYHPSAREEAMRHHREIVAAIEAGSPEAARQAMREHLAGVERNLRELDTSGKP